MKKILIIGGTGFVGSRFIDDYQHNYKMKVLNHRNKIPHINVEYVHGDVLDKNSLDLAFEHVDVVVNLIGQITPDLILFQNLNIKGNKNIIDMCNKHRVKKIILASSALVYGECEKIKKETDQIQPSTIYGRIKAEVESLYEDLSIPVITLRLTNVFGSPQPKGLFRNILDAMSNHTPLKLPSEEKVRNFIHVSDVSRAINLAMNINSTEVFNIGSPQSIKIQDCIKIALEEWDINLTTVKHKAHDENKIIVDVSKAEKQLKFKAKIPLREGLREIIENEKNI